MSSEVQDAQGVSGRPAEGEGHAAISRRAGTVGGLTLLSRIAGLIRDMVVAYAFGARATADAFYVAFRIPNLMRRLLAEGALTMAFLPIYSEYKRKSASEAATAASTIFTALLVFLTLLVLLGMLATPWIVQLVAYGFVDEPEKFALTVSLSRLMFPYLMMASVMALLMAILNSWRHFAAPAAAPIALNGAMILGALVFAPWFAQPVYGLAVGVLVGGLLQIGVQCYPLLRRHLFPRLTLSLTHPSLQQLVRIMIPSVYGGAVYQLNVLMITLFASFLPHGSVSYLWYADRITEFPLGIFAVALATVTLPTLSEQQSAGDGAAFRATYNFGLRLLWAGALPATVGLMILAEPIVRLLFQGGAFTAASTQATADALFYFAMGIPCVSGVRNTVPAFYAMKDAKTPVKVATITLLVNAAAAWSLMRPMQHAGLAFAMVISTAVQFALLTILLRRQLGPLGGRRLLRSFLGSSVAAMAMGMILWMVVRAGMITTMANRWHLLLAITGLVLLGSGIYYGLLWMLNREEARHLWWLVRRR
ncbi:MAG: murein biosynthesis integral membrane protein MurJ [Deltaproteobacteria bacterium]|nr:murein biosynthesis integral membrane protein MurJ [Deltaproteobacteria bacterium]